jgi:hypothetical protein
MCSTAWRQGRNTQINLTIVLLLACLHVTHELTFRSFFFASLIIVIRL